jgi:hypothetical protein
MPQENVVRLVDKHNVQLSIQQRQAVEIVEPFFSDFYKKLGEIYRQHAEIKRTHEQQPLDGLKTPEILQPLAVVHDSFKVPVHELSEDKGYELYTNLIEAQKATGIEHVKFRYNRSTKEITCVIDGASLPSLEPRGELKQQFYNSIVKSTDKRGSFVAKVTNAQKVPKHFELFFDEFYENLGRVYQTALSEPTVEPNNVKEEKDSDSEEVSHTTITDLLTPSLPITVSQSPKQNVTPVNASPLRGTPPQLLPLPPRNYASSPQSSSWPKSQSNTPTQLTPVALVTDSFSVSVESLAPSQITSIFDNLERAQQLTQIQGITFAFNEQKQTIDIEIKNVPLEKLKPEGHLRDAFYQLALYSQQSKHPKSPDSTKKSGSNQQGCTIF